MSAVVDMETGELTEVELTTLYAALLAVQAELPRLIADSLNPHFRSKYVSLASLMAAILPLLNKCGIVLMQFPTTMSGEPVLTTRLVHAASGEAIESAMPLLVVKQDPQGLASAITYARRYALMAMLGLVADQDDDGNGASRPSAQAASQFAPPVAPTAKKATKKAVEYLDALIDRLTKAGALDAVRVASGMQQEYSTSLTSELTPAQASDMIARLEKLEKELG